MTDIELDKAKKELRDCGGSMWKGSEEQKKVHARLWCIEMINSIIAYSYCYGFPKGFTGEDFIKAEEKRHYNYLEEYIQKLGRTEVAKLVEEQINDVSTVQCGVFTDDEGCSYNSIVWKQRGVAV